MISGLASAARGAGGASDPAITILSRLLALVAGVGYLAAFAPPRWLREMGYRALAFDLVRAIVARPTGTQPRVLWGALAGVASSILGTSEVRISTHDGIEAVAADAEPDPATSFVPVREPAAADAPYSLSIPLGPEDARIGLLEARLAGRPLFLEDDIALVELLGSLTARAVEREQAIATLADAEREVSEAAAVRASEVRFRALLDAEPNAMLSTDRHGVIQWCTRSADGMFGSETSLVGRRLDSLLPPSVGTWGVDHTGPGSSGTRPSAGAGRRDLPGRGGAVRAGARRRAGPAGRRDRHLVAEGDRGDPGSVHRCPVTRAPDADHLDLRRRAAAARARRPARRRHPQRAARRRRGRGRPAAADGREPPDPRPCRTRRRRRRCRPRPAPAHPAQRAHAREGDVGNDDADGRHPGRAAVGVRGRGLHRAGPAEPHLECRQVRRRRRARRRLGHGRARRRDRGPGPGRWPGHRSGRGGPPVHAVLPLGVDRRGARIRDRPVRLPGADRRDGRAGVGDGRARRRRRVRFQPAAVRRGRRA